LTGTGRLRLTPLGLPVDVGTEGEGAGRPDVLHHLSGLVAPLQGDKRRGVVLPLDLDPTVGAEESLDVGGPPSPAGEGHVEDVVARRRDVIGRQVQVRHVRHTRGEDLVEEGLHQLGRRRVQQRLWRPQQPAQVTAHGGEAGGREEGVVARLVVLVVVELVHGSSAALRCHDGGHAEGMDGQAGGQVAQHGGGHQVPERRCRGHHLGVHQPWKDAVEERLELGVALRQRADELVSYVEEIQQHVVAHYWLTLGEGKQGEIQPD